MQPEKNPKNAVDLTKLETELSAPEQEAKQLPSKQLQGSHRVTLTRVITALAATLALATPIIAAFALSGSTFAPSPSEKRVEPVQVEGTASRPQVICPALPASLNESKSTPTGATLSPQLSLNLEPKNFTPSFQKLSSRPGTTAGATAGLLQAALVGELPPEAGEAQITQSLTWTLGDYTALASSPCALPKYMQSFIVPNFPLAEGTLSLSNPQKITANIQIKVWGKSGELMEKKILAVPGRHTQTVQLDSLLTSSSAYLLEVISSEVKISASLLLSAYAGLYNHGIEWVPTQAHAAPINILAGVPLSAAGGELTIVNPDPEKSAQVQVQLSSGTERIGLPGAQHLTVPARGTVNIDLAGLSLGQRSFIIESDTPIHSQIIAFSAPPKHPGTLSAPVAESKRLRTELDFSLHAPLTLLNSAEVEPAPGSGSTLVIVAAEDGTEVTIQGQRRALGKYQELSIPINGKMKFSANTAVYAAVTTRGMKDARGITARALQSSAAVQGTVALRLGTTP